MAFYFFFILVFHYDERRFSVLRFGVIRRAFEIRRAATSAAVAGAAGIVRLLHLCDVTSGDIRSGDAAADAGSSFRYNRYCSLFDLQYFELPSR